MQGIREQINQAKGGNLKQKLSPDENLELAKGNVADIEAKMKSARDKAYMDGKGGQDTEEVLQLELQRQKLLGDILTLEQQISSEKDRQQQAEAEKTAWPTICKCWNFALVGATRRQMLWSVRLASSRRQGASPRRPVCRSRNLCALLRPRAPWRNVQPIGRTAGVNAFRVTPQQVRGVPMTRGVVRSRGWPTLVPECRIPTTASCRV
jgi:hypothetical protein